MDAQVYWTHRYIGRTGIMDAQVIGRTGILDAQVYWTHRYNGRTGTLYAQVIRRTGILDAHVLAWSYMRKRVCVPVSSICIDLVRQHARVVRSHASGTMEVPGGEDGKYLW